jgi:hypothetical protein
MKKLIGAAAAALALAAGAAAGADARTEARVLVTVAPQGALTAPRALAPGAHTVVLRNRSAAARRVRIVRVPGGVSALMRFEGRLFLPARTRVTHDLGTVRSGRTTSARVRLHPGSYVVVALDGIAVAAARPLTVGARRLSAAGPTAERPLALRLLPQSYVGRVAGTPAFVGLSLDRGVVRAYVCDGTARRSATVARWLVGRWDGRSPRTLRAAGVELRLGAVHTDGSLAGSVRFAGGVHRFTLRPANGAAGLYDGAHPRRKQRASTVVLADGTYRGAMADPRPRRCRPVQVTLVDGTTQIVTVCKIG